MRVPLPILGRQLIAVLAATIAIVTACSHHQPAPTPTELLLDELATVAGPQAVEQYRQAPFLVTPHAGADLPALASIVANSRDKFPIPVPPHKIDDDTTWRIAPAHRFNALEGKHASRRLLNPYQWKLEVKNVSSIRVGVLSPAGIPANVPWEAIQEAIETNRHLTGADLPAQDGSSIVIVYGTPLSHHAQAISTDTHIGLRSAYADQPDVAAWILAHEITHRWWRGNAPYFDEGTAELVAAIATQSSRPWEARIPCAKATLDPNTPRPTQPCDYQLGGQLMAGLLRYAGPENFAAAMTELYLHAREGHVITIRHLRERFTSPGAQALIDSIHASHDVTTHQENQ